MAGFKKYEELSMPQFQKFVGWTSILYHQGKTPEEISSITKRPIEDIEKWLQIVKEADRAKEAKRKI